MPHSPSAKKRLRQNQKQRLRNIAVKSRMKTQVKKTLAVLESGETEKIVPALRSAISTIDKAASKGVLHKNAASRRKSRLTRKTQSTA